MLCEVRCREDDFGTLAEVVDVRDGSVLAVRSVVELAEQVAGFLNATYTAAPYPARDTLVHEIVGLRISGVAG